MHHSRHWSQLVTAPLSRVSHNMWPELPEAVRDKLKEYRDELDELRVFVRAPRVRFALPSTTRVGLTVSRACCKPARRRATTGMRRRRGVTPAPVVPRIMLTGVGGRGGDAGGQRAAVAAQQRAACGTRSGAAPKGEDRART